MRPRTRTRARRAVLRGLFTVSVLGAAAGALSPLLAHRTDDTVRDGSDTTGDGESRDDRERPDPAAPGSERFAEIYRGRRIEGGTTVLVPAGGGPGAARGAPSAEVRIDGRPLPVLRRADGSYLSAVDHYESHPTLRALARAAVDELGPQRLALTPAHGHGH
ncbi:tyrosinase family oxidase copper chaperone [Streptomyces sp. NPDC000594]|uniref:tyrosinase family oxidase copper chaperone n=1 Tax=Streptomyces sp. NPDC000594 TaxID=3154261 RepID=UPI00331C3F05